MKNYFEYREEDAMKLNDLCNKHYNRDITLMSVMLHKDFNKLAINKKDSIYIHSEQAMIQIFDNKRIGIVFLKNSH